MHRGALSSWSAAAGKLSAGEKSRSSIPIAAGQDEPHSSTCPSHRCGEPAPAPGCPQVPHGGTPGTSESCWEFCHWAKRGGEQGNEGWGERRSRRKRGRGRQFSLIWANPLLAKRSQNLTKKKIPSPAHVSPEQASSSCMGTGRAAGSPGVRPFRDRGTSSYRDPGLQQDGEKQHTSVQSRSAVQPHGFSLSPDTCTASQQHLHAARCGGKG